MYMHAEGTTEKWIPVIIFLVRRLRFFYELCAYISLGVRRKVYPGHCLRIPRIQGVPASAGIRKGVRNS